MLQNQKQPSHLSVDKQTPRLQRHSGQNIIPSGKIGLVIQNAARCAAKNLLGSSALGGENIVLEWLLRESSPFFLQNEPKIGEFGQVVLVLLINL